MSGDGDSMSGDGDSVSGGGDSMSGGGATLSPAGIGRAEFPDSESRAPSRACCSLGPLPTH